MALLTFGRISVDAIEPDSYRNIVQAWRTQRGDKRVPLAEQIEPFLVPSLAGNLILYEVAGDAFVFRILGEKVLTAVGTSLKGKSLFEALGETAYSRIIEAQLRECAATATPLFSRHSFHLEDVVAGAVPHSRRAWRIALPYGEPDRVTRLLCYQLFSEEIGPPRQRDLDFETLLPKTVFKINV